MLQSLPSRGFARIAANRLDSRKHSRHVSVEDRQRLLVGNAQNRGRAVAPDARQSKRVFQIPREFASMAFDNLSRCPLQVSRAGVIAEPRPQPQHFFLRRAGKRPHIGKSF